MAEYKWPEPEKRSLIGKRISRLDGPAKVSGKAKYTYDINRPGMLHAKVLQSPYAHAKIVSIDTSAAEKMPAVKAIQPIKKVGDEVNWAGDDVVALAAVDEPSALDALRAIKVVYEPLPYLVTHFDLKVAGERAKPNAVDEKGEPAKAFADAEVVSEGVYGMPMVCHCCLEAHGAITEWEDDNNALVHISTQAVSGMAAQMAPALKVPAGNIRVKMDHVGGGFGSKFQPDVWGIATGQLSKQAGGKPVKLMLERSSEMMVAGTRPSIYGKAKVGAKKDGTIVAWQSETWGSGGPGVIGSPPLPYLFDIPNQSKQYTGIANNVAPQRAWRAPSHPQAAIITICALDDLAAKLNMDALEFFLKNIDLVGQRAEVYREEFKIASDLIGWKQNWHPRGDKTAGPIKRGLGLSLHTWGGRGHDSNCDLTIHPDGSVDLKMGTQDLGTGTRTAITIVAADSLGLPMERVKAYIGDNHYPVSGGSGGSTTIGGVSSATRRAALDALDQLFAKVAPSMSAQPGDLEAFGGQVRLKSDPTKAISWDQACGKMGGNAITARGKNPGPGNLMNSGVGGVQMADVSVDIETGVVRLNKLVAVQDCGLVIDLKTAESQVYGAMIMGISSALFEERVMDQQVGRLLNPNMEQYKLAGIADIGELVVHMMTGKGYDERGVIGLGEPPVVSPGPAISNAVANAIGVRVPYLPLSPERVLKALEQNGGSHASV